MPSQIEQLIANVPENKREAAKKAIPSIAKALDKEGILTPRTLAYAVATVQHESSFEPKEEIQGRSQARKYGYSGGENFYGRGYIQLTHDYNYKKYGDRIGEDLVGKPERLLDPEVSAKVLAAYMKDSGVADAAEQGDYTRARVLVQGKGATSPQFIGALKDIANNAQKYEKVTQNIDDIKRELTPQPEPTPTPQVFQQPKIAQPEEKNVFQKMGEGLKAGVSKAVDVLTPDVQASGGGPSQPVNTPSPAPTPTPLAPPGATPTPSLTPSPQPSSVPVATPSPTPDPLSQGPRPYRTEAGGLYQTQGFGANAQYYRPTGLEGHEGMDYRMDKGTEVFSPVDGEVVYVGSVDHPTYKNSYGNFAIIRTPNNEALQMAHFDSLNVKPGQQLKQGELVGRSGASGAKVGGKEQPHLHIGYSKDANKVVENIQQFEKTGQHKYPNAGFDDPSQVFTDDYTKRVVSPSSVVKRPEAVKDVAVASPSAQTRTPLAQGRNAVQKALTQPIQNVTSALQKPLDQAKNAVQQALAPSSPINQGPAQPIRNTTPQGQGGARTLSSKLGEGVTRLTEGMKNPIAFAASPSAQLETPQRLQTQAQRQPDQPTLPAPAFDVGTRPQTKVSASQPFSPGFSQQTSGITKTFADVVKQNLATPQTPQQQEQQQSQQPGQQQQQNQQTNYAQAQQAALKTRQEQQAKQKAAVSAPSSPGNNMSIAGSRPAAAPAVSSVKRASPISNVASPNSYTVKKGDTLWGIAQKTTGSGANYKQLGYKGDPKKLAVGTKLSIPRPR